MFDKYPGGVPNSDINPNIVDAKLGAKSWALCIEVITTAELKQSPIVINVRHMYGWSLTKVMPIKKHPGIKWAVEM